MSEIDDLRAEIREMSAPLMREVIVVYYKAYCKAYDAWSFLRYAAVAQFALWCVWLA